VNDQYGWKFPDVDLFLGLLVAFASWAMPLVLIVQNFLFGELLNTLLQIRLLEHIVRDGYTEVHKCVEFERYIAASEAL
jgi:hypothetical protein